jgi:sugar/nucleoside kinase (ribokinase family)
MRKEQTEKPPLRPTITIVGHVCLDNNIVDGISRKSWGSAAMYIARYLAKEFSIRPSIISAYGNDFRQHAAGFTLVGESGDHPTLLYENRITNGHRVQLCHHRHYSPPVKLRQEVTDLLSKTDLLIVAPMLANYSVEYIQQIMRYVSKKSLKALLPQGYMRSINENNEVEKRHFIEAPHILPYFDAVIASEEDGNDTLQLASTWATYKQRSSIVITQAEKGATLFYQGETRHIPTVPLPLREIKNPVGSGDTFSAQFVMGLHEGHHPSDAVRHAHAATARALRGA